jgi:dipeptidyl aminopeptidase/acylaminoacyl peptidase
MSYELGGVRRTLIGVLLFAFVSSTALGQSKPEEVVFPSGKLELHGLLWKPEGAGPFPAVLWNHGSQRLPGSQPPLAAFYTAHSYVFFVPHRRGQGRSPGDYIQDRIAQAPAGERAQRMLELQEADLDDVVAALDYLKRQPLVDPGRIAISGCSYGRIKPCRPVSATWE